jgi:GTP-binding protein YchF
MRCGIIGLPQTGKTSIFRVLTRSLAPDTHRHGETQHIGVVEVPDFRLDRLAALFSPQKITYATVEYVDVAALGEESLKETAYLSALRQVDALFHVVRCFADDTVPHSKGSVDPHRDLASVELDLILSDLAVIENRLAKLEKDRRKIQDKELEIEQALLERARQWVESDRPLRAASWTPQERKRLKGFAFLSEKPMLLVLNVGEEQVSQSDQILSDPQVAAFRQQPQTQALVVCGKLEAELAQMPESEAKDFLLSYGLSEPGRDRLIRATHEILGLICFLTVGEKECRAWSIPRDSTAVEAAAAIHSDLAKHFIRAEVIPWDQLLEAGSLAAARQRGTLRLEGKDYVVHDGEIVHIRHSG